MELLNINYYKKLVNKFCRESFNNELILSDKFIDINYSFFDKALRTEDLNLFIQIPSTYLKINLLFANIFFKAAAEQFLNAEENPIYEIRDKLKANKRNKEYEIIEVRDGLVTLEEIIKGKKSPHYYPERHRDLSLQKLKNEYTKIDKGLRKSRLDNCRQLFNKLFNIDYIPPSFKSKSIIVCSKKIWESFSEIKILDSNLKSLIPSIYINRNGNETKSINIDPAIYFVSDYCTAYDYIIKKNIKIDNIIILDRKVDNLPTIIQDQLDKKFKLFGIVTTKIENPHVKVWKWLKEEIKIINEL